MTDVLSQKQRSFNMSRIRNKNTKPEILVRQMIHKMGFRFRLHDSHLSGKPDLVFKAKRKIVFVHGCYWHLHSCRYGRVVPKTNSVFWKNKREENVRRDAQHVRKLKRDGWAVLIVWECWLRRPEWLKIKLAAFLE
jgi:DNA mismatch endonuclease (patch repair protein)